MATGTVLGAASLAIQLSNGCLKGYGVVTSALAASKELSCVLLQFEIEQSRLRDFVEAAGLTDETTENNVRPAILAKGTLLLRILAEIQLALSQFSDNNESQRIQSVDYANPTIPHDLGESFNNLINEAFVASQKPPDKFSLLRSLNWSLFRRSELEKALKRLARLNDFLRELLNTQDLRLLQDQQHHRSMELVQMRNKLDDILELTQAVQASRLNHSQSDTWQRLADAELDNLAAFKALYMSLLAGETSQPGKTRIDPSRISFQPAGTESANYRRATYTTNEGRETEVWIHWQDVDIPTEGSMRPAALMDELTILLNAQKPDEFCIPPCLGWSPLREGGAQPLPAFVFENPPGVDSKAIPVSLLHAMKHSPKPSLTHRVTLAYKIAQCLLYFHVVNWLHKALRASNIIMFSSSDNDLDIRSPYLIGFNNSRRSQFGEATSEVPRDGHMEVYRHPDTQLDGPMLPFRKTFDIYSLGLILVEIAFWKPIVAVMEIEEIVNKSPRATRDIQERWVHTELRLLASLRAEVGAKYSSAVEVCLKGRDAFGIDRRDTETSSTTAMVIQRTFNAQVVRVLAEIAV
ncbi:uncharacterized protein PV07_02206 [Cladophialophora immunda]|uniref:Uncharacterized protein n=1 Tax=Cladophialophora immunda TaxID=569365 RepID=A0A0D2D006_9EURO|nr:uncharacterized protein PV07_02206 [Cladophialophora immunda]KIW35515.1 hypothetical protein PV07_02206 [Cladophialophora immunda]